MNVLRDTIPRVTGVEALGEHRLRLTFDDGLVRELDFEDDLWGEMFEPLKDPAFFAQVFLDQESGTIAWPNGLDLDATVLHGDEMPVDGHPPKVLNETRVTLG